MKKYIVHYFPTLGKLKRFLVALYNHFRPIKQSYSQHNEDYIVKQLLQHYRIDKNRDIYIDIGANHPTDISNTYLFYRLGFKGVVIDPNTELISLFKLFRKRDIALAIGCSNNNSIAKFNISKTPVISSFSENFENDVYKSLYCPLIKLDDVVVNIEFETCYLLSIDVEGLNFEALLGSVNTLNRVLFLCIEFDNNNEEEKITDLLKTNNFLLIDRIHCNLLFINNELKAKLKL